MKLQVQCFAAARDLVGGQETVEIDVVAPATAADVFAELAVRYPSLSSLITRSRLAVDVAYVSTETVIEAGPSRALIPPVSGG
ncbi:MAG: MoaD/ThiS family protein [Planctomycetota bacterium]